jgi:hypothetical protein
MSWTPNVRIPDQLSKATPALSLFGGDRLHIVHLGDSSNMLWHSSTDGSVGWTRNLTIPGQLSKAPPALSSLGNPGMTDERLHLVHLGDSSNMLWHSIYDNDSGWSPNVTIPNQLSWAAPALAQYAGRLHMVHLGNSSSILWHSVYDGNSWSPNVTIPNQLSKAAPALSTFALVLDMVHLGDSSNNLWESRWS